MSSLSFLMSLLSLLRIYHMLSASSHTISILVWCPCQISTTPRDWDVCRMTCIACLCTLILQLAGRAWRNLKDRDLIIFLWFFFFVVCLVEFSLQSLSKCSIRIQASLHATKYWDCTLDSLATKSLIHSDLVIETTKWNFFLRQYERLQKTALILLMISHRSW